MRVGPYVPFKVRPLHFVACAIAAWFAILSPEMIAQTVDIPTSSSVPTTLTVSRFEAGLQFTDIAFQPCDSHNPTCSLPPQLALGADVAINIKRYFAIDTSFSLTPQYQSSVALSTMQYPDGSVSGGHGLEFLVGPHVEVRGGRLGLFLAARAGFLNWSRTLQDINGAASPISYRFGGNNFFAAELATGAEYALTHRTHVRVDIGDQIIQYHSATGESPVISIPNIPSTTKWVSSTAFVRTGVFVGFGPTEGHTPALQEHSPHRFFDRTNVALMTLTLLAQTSDYVTTRRVLAKGSYETNGLARPFLNQGWSGDIPVALITNSVEIGIMYGLHKMGHHRFERLPPLFILGGCGHSSYENIKNE